MNSCFSSSDELQRVKGFFGFDNKYSALSRKKENLKIGQKLISAYFLNIAKRLTQQNLNTGTEIEQMSCPRRGI